VCSQLIFQAIADACEERIVGRDGERLHPQQVFVTPPRTPDSAKNRKSLGGSSPQLKSVTRLFEPALSNERHQSFDGADVLAYLDDEDVPESVPKLVPMLPGDHLSRRLNTPRKNPIASVLCGRTNTALFLPHSIKWRGHGTVCAEVAAQQGATPIDRGQAAPDGDVGVGEREKLDESLKDLVCHEDTPLPAGSIVYSGSFNPLHEGHVRLALAAQRASMSSEGQQRRAHLLRGEKISGDPLSRPSIVFEISANNADKPPLALEELEKRLRQVRVPRLVALSWSLSSN